MFKPGSTYRIQFHKGFTFNDFENIIPYLAGLGIRTIYASPIFKAAPGSMHGYDITDPLQINPEIGTLMQLKSISKKLKKLNISWLQDIVPNHMAFHPGNKWLMDVLENGRESQYGHFFDILWDSPVYEGKLMVPFLGKTLDEVIADNELKVIWDGKPMFDYSGQRYPINTTSFETITKLFPKSISNPGKTLQKINADKNLLKQLAGDQHYALCYWQQTDKLINFRRFFTVNGLICLNMQDEAVFDQYHQLIKQLVKTGIFQGLRVDHIDGLYDPATYLQRLRKLAGANAYIIVEKILEEGEEFPSDWPVQGNTGYDFLSAINNLFTSAHEKKAFTEFYNTIDPDAKPVKEGILDKKRLILNQFMQGELENLYQLFKTLKLADDHEIAIINAVNLKDTIADLLVRCPIYRYYGNAMPLGEAESVAIYELLQNVAHNNAELMNAADLLENCLLHKPRFGDEDYNSRALRFYQRLMQFTGPLMAKGVEDTLMYTYNRFVDHNEVGDSPTAFGISQHKFHQVMAGRQQLWLQSLNASSTHDTKRGEDMRARLNILSDLPEEWIANVRHWQKMNAKLKQGGFPDANDEYFIYQTIAGAHPMPGQDEDDFSNRLQEYLVKALREAKKNSNWAQPNEAYEEAVKKFIISILNKKSAFWKSFSRFHSRFADFGIVNSLAQVVLKYTCPGIPDLYQSAELWDLSLVDPDNRRPVDYTKRQAFLNDETNDWEQLWDNRYDGRVKLKLISKLLRARNESPDIFDNGEYIPLTIKGQYKKHVLAFARRYGTEWRIVALPLHLAAICPEAGEINQFDWKNTRIILPQNAPLAWQNQLSWQRDYSSKSISVSKIFNPLPVALLKLRQHQHNRSAGILMPVASLPAPFGIGDMGPQAFKFADFLFQSRQKYWQLLPVNPVDKNAGFSPYSSASAMAGNTSLISPELLCSSGLLTKDDLEKHRSESSNTNYIKAADVKNVLFAKAYQNFLTLPDDDLKKQFEDFKVAEAYWLDEFALYAILKINFKGKPWYQWPPRYKRQNKEALQKFSADEKELLDQVKWLQFTFAVQWKALKNYCSERGIILLGDMPFYTSYDSADVWAKPEIFKLDKKGNMTGIAGVPPDYFSAEGQLWGMPVYRWDVLKATQYDWWVKRIKKNLEYFDLIRLDHFRAFSSYWEVPGGSKNAVNGNWMPGPGNDLFETLKKELGSLPFVAEDLGDIDDAVYQLRDAFGLPGMRVLQFAFDAAMPVSGHIPHNYSSNSFAYTGTHDNSTVRGWFENDIDYKVKRRVEKYTGKKISRKNIHRVMARLCYASVAQVAILQMQDVLGLGAEARMNIPASAAGNWTWRLDERSLTPKLVRYLEKLVTLYNR